MNVPNDQLREYEYMWTDKKDNCFLVEDAGRPAHLPEHDIFYWCEEQQELLFVLIDDDALAAAIRERMLRAGVRVVPTMKDALTLARRGNAI